MKTYVQPGDKIDILSTGAVAVGVALRFGDFVGIAQNATTAANQPLVLQIAGVMDVAKVASQAWTFGQRVYWDNTAARFTNVSAAGLVEVGHAMAAVAGGAGDVVGRVRFHGAPRIV